jgi:molecular chaperone GrpE
MTSLLMMRRVGMWMLATNQSSSSNVTRQFHSSTQRLLQCATPSSLAAATRCRHFSTEADKGQSNAEQVKSAAESAPNATAAADEALAKVKAELDEMKKQLQYAMADRENVRRILLRDVKEARDTGLRDFAKDLLDVSDNFERALDASKADAERLAEVKLLHDGVAMTEAQLHKVFERFGIKRFKPLGDKFDPAHHSALLEMDTPDYPDGHVGIVIKNGFMLKDRVLRPADVGVVRKPKSQ